MNVSEAVSARMSCRAFLDKPVDTELLRELLAKASRSPSGGNIQPWRVWVINGDSMDDFLEFSASESLKATQPEPEYDIYPPKLWEPYRSARYELGEQMYGLLGIPREDKKARLERMEENFSFFGARTALFLFLDRRFGSPQWSDCGMFLQTLMLLASEAGLASCAQESWSTRHRVVSEFVGASEELMLFCGLALGYADPSAAVNRLRSERFSVDEFAVFL